MDDISLKRNAVKQVYNNPTWSAKVDAMSNNQVLAVYFKFKRANKV